MKFSFKFSNILGAVYRKGDALFTPDGNSLISPVGNRICVYNLKGNTSSTLPIESRYNYECLAISPSGNLLIAVNEEGEAHFITLITKRKLLSHRFNEKVRCIRFSPNGKYFAVCKTSKVFLYRAPEYNSPEHIGQLTLEKVFSDFYDDTICLDWTDDSRILAIGSSDGITKLYSIVFLDKFRPCTLTGHTDQIIAVFFESDSLHINILSRNGQLSIWECNLDLKSLSPCERPSNLSVTVKDEEEEDDIPDPQDNIEVVAAEQNPDIRKMVTSVSIIPKPESKIEEDRIRYTRLAKHYLNDYHKFEKRVSLSCSSYHRNTRILVTGFSNGSVFIHELPDVVLIHSLSVSDSGIATISMNNIGDWITVGCENQGQLLVWEWQSETYVLKQQAHTSFITCLSYSPDASYIVTGGIDGKVKVWNVQSSYCFVTFSEHSCGITDVKFSHNRKFVISSSLDGTIRAFDLQRYRNFRTFTTPRPVQFSCLAIDSTDEFIGAGAKDVFEIYLWSMRLGQLLECLAGHEGPVSGIAFSPVASSSAFVSVSWDRTLRIWNTIEGEKEYEAVQLGSEGLSVAYRWDGKEVAVSTLNGHITFFSPENAQQTRYIEGRNDLGSGRSAADQITAKKNLEAKAFMSINYSPDGNFIIAAGQSKNVCIYHVTEGILLKKFEITQNRSLDAVDEYINFRKLTEFGNVDLIEKREEMEGGKNVKISLPGVREGDMSTRSLKPEIRVFGVAFSPTGLAWVAATTEGVLIYSSDSDFIFDPFLLDEDVTTDSVRQHLAKQDYVKALVMALKLGETNLIQNILERTPSKNVELVIRTLPTTYTERLLKFLAVSVESTPRVEFYLTWVEHLVNSSHSTVQSNHALMLTLNRNLMKKYTDISKICDFNTYTMKFILKRKQEQLSDVLQDVNM